METKKALSGIRVLDLSQMAAGPITTLKLGMLGAEVLKVEQPGVGEKGRNDNMIKYPDGKIPQSYKWALLHSNKKSITLNLKNETAKGIFEELVKQCDVLVENFGPGTIERLGFPWEKVHEINPKMIMCQIKGYHPLSPFSKFKAMDAIVQSTAGLACQTGLKDLPPVIANVALADIPTGDYALTGILAALYQREHTGEGQHVEVYMQEVVLDYSRLSLANDTFKRGVPMQFIGKNGPKKLFKCKPRYEGDEDCYCFIAIKDSKGQSQWKSICELMNRMDLFEDPRCVNGPARCDNAEFVEGVVAEWTATLDKEEVMNLLSDQGITAGATFSVQEIKEMPYMYESGFFRNYNHPVLGEIMLPAMAVRLSESPVDIEHSPDLGEHTDEVYKELLGMTEEQLAAYKAEGAI